MSQPKSYPYAGKSVGAFLVADAAKVNVQLAAAGYEAYPLPKLTKEYLLARAAAIFESQVTLLELKSQALIWVGGGEWTQADWAGPYSNAFAAVYARRKPSAEQPDPKPVLYTISYVNSTAEAVATNKRIWALPAELGEVRYQNGGRQPSLEVKTAAGDTALRIQWNRTGFWPRLRLPAVPMSQRARYATEAGVESELTMTVKIALGTASSKKDVIEWDHRSAMGRFLTAVDAKAILLQDLLHAQGDVFEPAEPPSAP
jgi:hypothetical protein